MIWLPKNTVFELSLRRKLLILSIRLKCVSPKSHAASGGDKTARVLEAATGKEISRLKHPYLVDVVAFSPDDK